MNYVIIRTIENQIQKVIVENDIWVAARIANDLCKDLGLMNKYEDIEIVDQLNNFCDSFVLVRSIITVEIWKCQTLNADKK